MRGLDLDVLLQFPIDIIVSLKDIHASNTKHVIFIQYILKSYCFGRICAG